MIAAAALLGVRVLVHPLLMTYQGSRHEGRVAAFHALLGIAAGVAVAVLRRARDRRWFWIVAGLLGGALDWALDYGYMADHVVSQSVFYVLNWLDSSSTSNAIPIGFGILQTLRFTGLVGVFWLGAAWDARSGPRLRIALFSLLALAFRSPVKGYALAPELLLVYPGQAALYFMSFLALFYGLAGAPVPCDQGVQGVDVNSVK